MNINLQDLVVQDQQSGLYILTAWYLSIESIETFARQFNFSFYYFNAKDVVNANDFFSAIIRILHLPYPNLNWNALPGVMLEFPKEDKVIMLFENFESFSQSNRSDLFSALRIIHLAAINMNKSRKFYILLRGDENLIPIEVFIRFIA